MQGFKLSVILGLLFFSSCNWQSEKKSKPNVIIILTDDQGYGDVGFNGSKQLNTPNLDRIAKNGVVFTNGYASYSVCGPSRAGIITGRYQDKFGYSRNPLFIPKDASFGLPLDQETLAEALKKAGYKNMAIGKWHLGAHKTQRPLERGFHEFFGFLSGGHKYFPKQLTRNDISEVGSQFDAYNTKILRNNTRIDETAYLTDAFSREAVNFVANNAHQPFFLYLAYNAPHAPLQATEKYLSRYKHLKNKKRRTYTAMVSAVDDGVGHLLDKLKELKIEKNTLVFFLSDNGGKESKGSDNGPLKRGKGSLHEGGIRVPFAVQWPGTIPSGKIYKPSIISLDIFSTAIAQVNIAPKNKLDGVNLIPYLQGKIIEKPHKELFWRMYDKASFAVLQNDLKLIKNNKGEMAFYNLAADISEKKSIKDSIAQKKLYKLFSNWNSLNKNPIFKGLKQNKQYNLEHPNRFKNIEKY